MGDWDSYTPSEMQSKWNEFIRKNSVKITKYSNDGIKVMRSQFFDQTIRSEGEYSSKLIKTSFVDRHAELMNYGNHFEKENKRRVKSIKHMFGYSKICQIKVKQNLLRKQGYRKNGTYGNQER